MKKLMLILPLFLMMAACSSAPKRTILNDKNLRVFLDPDSIDTLNYVQVQLALVKSGKFLVIDRSDAYHAVQKEQERLHRKEVDRFDDKEKWAHWGKLYGVGAIVTAHSQCYKQRGFWHADQVDNVCKQFLSLIDASTGEVIIMVDGDGKAPSTYDHQMQVAPSWDDTVDKFVNTYPERWNNIRDYEDPILHYQAVSKEEALRQKERHQQAGQ